MLPKLKRLNDAAGRQRVAYLLATNFVHRLDTAVIREGRFDDRHGIYPPDAVSRIGRLLQQYEIWTATPPDSARLLKAVTMTTGAPMGSLARPGWYVRPRKGSDTAGTLFGFVENATPFKSVAAEARYDRHWKRPKITALETEYWTSWMIVEKLEERLRAAIAAKRSDLGAVARDVVGLGVSPAPSTAASTRRRARRTKGKP
jgi:hypothetical protein